MAAHRYWRLNVSENFDPGVHLIIGTIQLRTASCGAGPLAGGLYDWPYIQDYAFDSDSSNRWINTGGVINGAWIGYGFADAVDVQQVAIKAWSSYPGAMPKDFDIQYSGDGISWTTKQAITGSTGWANDETRTFNCTSDSNTHKYWRIYITDNNGDANVQVCELEFRGSLGGADLTATEVNTNAIARGIVKSGEFGDGYESSKAFDNDTSTRWINTGGIVDGAWIGFDFGAANAKDIQQIAIISWSSFPEAMPKDFDIQYSDDLVNWSTKQAVTGSTDWGATETRTFNCTSDNNAHRAWRIYVTDNNGSANVQLSELQFRASLGGSDETDSPPMGTAAASTYVVGYEPSKAFDFDPSNGWQATDRIGWISFDFGSGCAADVVQISITSARDAGLLNSFPKSFTLEYSDNDSDWTIASRYLDVAAWTVMEVRIFDPAPPSFGNFWPFFLRYLGDR